MAGVLIGFAITWAVTRDRRRSIAGALAAAPVVAPFFFSAYYYSDSCRS